MRNSIKDDIISIITSDIKFLSLSIVLNLFILLKRFKIIETIDFNMAYRDNEQYIKDYTIKAFDQGVLVGLVLGTILFLLMTGVGLLISTII